MEPKLNINIALMFFLSLVIGYIVFGILSPPDIGAVYGVGFIVGHGVSSTLIPLLVVTLPAVIFKYFNKKPMPGYYIGLWVVWAIFAVITIYGNLTSS